jgi:hypothetical protein
VNIRWLVLALLVAPMLLLAGLQLSRQSGTAPLLPALDPDAVARIEIARGREQVVLIRRLDTGQWEIPSAADAPGDQQRIEQAIAELAALRGRPLAGNAPPQRREPLEIRLQDSAGETLGHAAFWADEAARRPDGPRLAIERPPALPLWPSAWSGLGAPRIPVGEIRAAERVTPEGPVPLTPDEAVVVARMLDSLAPTDFVAGATVDWMGARHVRVRLADGATVDLLQVPDGDGRYHLRLASDTRTDIRASRRFAFRVAEPLP